MMLESSWGFETSGGTAGLTLVETQDGDGSAFTPAATTIPSGYREIIITGLVHSTGTGNDNLEVVINGDSSDANYASVRLSNATDYQYNGVAKSRWTGATSSAASGSDPVYEHTSVELTIPRYASNSAHKWISSRGAWWANNISTSFQEIMSIRWENTDAITSVQLAWNSASTMSAGSTFSVWVR